MASSRAPSLHMHVQVIRDGEPSEISSDDLVVGDLLIIDAGDILVADGVLVTEHGRIIPSFRFMGHT